MPAWSLELILVCLGLVLLMVEAFVPSLSKRTLAWLSIAGLVAVFSMLFIVHRPVEGYWGFYATDKLAFFYKGIALVSTALVLLMSIEFSPVLEQFLDRERDGQVTGLGEFMTLPLFICAGLMWMGSMTDLTAIFVTLELVTVSFYVMVAFMRRNLGSLEAGVKYLILGALSTGFLVYGMAWLFGVTGHTHLAEIKAALGQAPRGPALFAIALILVGMAFKVGAVPFQFWVPDVYQGAPTPISAFLSVGSKAAGVAVFTRILDSFFGASSLTPTVVALLGALAGATLIVGNLAAIPQSNFKRLLAYSSISHAGFILLIFAGAGHKIGAYTPSKIAAFYLATYLLMTMASFLVLTLVRRAAGSDDFRAFDGLGSRNRFLAIILTIAAASLAGVPLTAGFVGKFFAIMLSVQAKQWALLALAIIGAAAGFYYYFKVIRSMYWNAAPADAPVITVSPVAKVVLVALAAAMILFGFWAEGLLGLL